MKSQKCVHRKGAKYAKEKWIEAQEIGRIASIAIKIPH
jgi:hypothetical protein